MEKTVVPIFFTVDKNYVPYLSVALLSLTHNTSDNCNYNIHIIYETLSDEEIEKLKKLEKSNVKIIFNKMMLGLESITRRKENELRENLFTLTIYYRLFLPSIFKEYDKGIYIDSDTCILSDVKELYDFDLKDNLFAGCTDMSCKNNKDLCNYFKMNAGVGIDKYINSGVLVMNMKKLREVNFDLHFLYLLDKYHFDTVCPDQDYINAMGKDNILNIPNEWNAMPAENEKAFDNPKIVHYNLFFKPWHYDNIDYENYFWQYAEKSPFKEEIYKEKENYDEAKKLEDKKSFDILLSRAEQITKSTNTFKNVFESGKEKRF